MSHRRARRTEESYKRKSKKVRPNPFFIIVCEGKISEVDYFKSFPYYSKIGSTTISGQYFLHQPVYIEGSAGQHAQVVRAAEKVFKEKKKAYVDIRPEEVWCVFDCDKNIAELSKAVKLAEAKKFKPIYSIQCFELWYLLHFQYLSTAIEKEHYDKKIGKALGISYAHGTTGMYQRLLPYQETALMHAKALWEQKKKDNLLFEDPVTNVQELVLALNDAYSRVQR